MSNKLLSLLFILIATCPIWAGCGSEVEQATPKPASEWPDQVAIQQSVRFSSSGNGWVVWSTAWAYGDIVYTVEEPRRGPGLVADSIPSFKKSEYDKVAKILREYLTIKQP